MPSFTGEQLTVIGEVMAERNAQDSQWGGPAADDLNIVDDWATYIAKQLSLIDFNGGGAKPRLVKIAALAIAAIESIERKEKAHE
jgi:hypothetical protein